MSRIILLLIPLIALVSGQSDNSTATVPPSNTTTIATTIVTNATTAEPITNTTTLAPTTTVRPTTTPTPSPTIPPTQDPQQWNGTVTKGNNTCINVQFKVQISVKYNTTMNRTETTKFNIPTDAKVNEDKSYCSSNATQLEAIVIDFADNFTSGILTLVFNKTQNEAFVQEIELSYNLTKTQFPSYVDSKQYNQMVTVRQTDLKLFKVTEKRSYTCSNAQSAKPTQENKNLPKDADIEFTNSQVEAYIDQKKAGKFDDALDCATTNVSDVVPIAVGAALAGLVVIVLIAYFIGRRRSRRLAYQSV